MIIKKNSRERFPHVKMSEKKMKGKGGKNGGERTFYATALYLAPLPRKDFKLIFADGLKGIDAEKVNVEIKDW